MASAYRQTTEMPAHSPINTPVVAPRRSTRPSANAADRYASVRSTSGTASLGDPQAEEARVQIDEEPEQRGHREHAKADVAVADARGAR